jgi:hypothetical protein
LGFGYEMDKGGPWKWARFEDDIDVSGVTREGREGGQFAESPSGPRRRKAPDE